MSHVTFPTEAEARYYQAIADKANGYPSSAHVHSGGGRHVVVDPKVPGPGWTIHFDEPRKHPSKEEWAHIKVSLPSALPGSLSEADIVAHEAKNAEAKELTEDWDGSDI